MSISILRRLLMKQAMKKSAPFQHEGIMSINKNLVRDVDNTVKKWVESAKSQGQDIDKMSEQELKYLIELNKPKGPTINEWNYQIDSPEGRRFMESIKGTPEGRVLLKSLIKPKAKVIDASSSEGKGITNDLFNMLDRQSGKNVIKTDFGKPFAEEVGSADNIIKNIKNMEPMDAMKEANSVIGRKGVYKNLTPEESKKILKETEDHIFERDIPIDPEDMADGGRTGYKDGEDVFIGPKRKKKTKKELEDEKKLREKIEAYIELQTINLPEEDPLKKYQPIDYSLYGGFMDNIKGEQTGNIINDFNNSIINPKDARVGISRFNPKTDSSFVAGVGPSGFNIGFKKPFADGGVAGLLGERTESTVAKPKRGLVDEAGSYAGLSSTVNLGYHGTSPAIADAIAKSGFKGGTVPTWAGKGNVFTSPNINVASRYGPSKLGVVTSAKNLTSPIGGGFNKSGISFGKEIVSSPTQATKGMNAFERMKLKYPNSPTFQRLLNTGTTAVKKSVNTLAPKLLGGLGFLFDAAPVNADEIDGFDMKAMMAKEALFKRKQKQADTFKQIRETELAKQAAAQQAAAAKQAQRSREAATAARAMAKNPQVYRNAGITSGGFASQNTGTNQNFSNKTGRGRTGYKEGLMARQKFGFGRRAFLKWMAGTGAGIGAAKSGLFGLLKGGGKKQAAKEVIKSAGSGTPPPYFFKLVDKIKMMGDDALATQDKAISKKYKDYTMEEDFAGNIEIIKKNNDIAEDVYMSYKVDEVPTKIGKKKSAKVEEYEEFTATPDGDGKMKNIEQGVPDEVVNEGSVFDDDYVKFSTKEIEKASGGRVPLSGGGLAGMLGE